MTSIRWPLACLQWSNPPRTDRHCVGLSAFNLYWEISWISFISSLLSRHWFALWLSLCRCLRLAMSRWLSFGLPCFRLCHRLAFISLVNNHGNWNSCMYVWHGWVIGQWHSVVGSREPASPVMGWCARRLVAWLASRVKLRPLCFVHGGRFFSPKTRRLRRICDASSVSNGGGFDILSIFPPAGRVDSSASVATV